MTDAAPAHVFDVEQQSFEADVLQASLTTPVLVDFWATWCEPCKTLGPMLEKLAAEYNGAFRLGKVDVDKQQELAGMFGIRSIPTVVLVKDGQVLDGFAGALPEGRLREFLSRHVQPAEAAETDEAEDNTELEAPAQAIDRLQQAIAAEPDKAELKLELALALMHDGRTGDAEATLAALPANLATDARAVRLRNELDLAHALKGAPGIAELQQRIQANAEDWEARDQLGLHLLQSDAAGALDQFLVILQKARDWNDGQARKRLLAAFATLDDAELVGRYRRKMASLLF